MNISISWVFDHINADFKTIDIPALIDLFNKKTAEIESFRKVEFDVGRYSLAQVVSVDSEKITVHSDEWKLDLQLPYRVDGLSQKFYLIKKIEKGYRWATLVDLHCSGKEGCIPALYVQKELRLGGWKQQVETVDYILEVDNKTITHRPDMWGHRGFAREIAALLDFEFLPKEKFLAQKKVAQFDAQSEKTEDSPILIYLKNQEVGKRFAGIFLSEVENRPSSFSMAYRLARIGNRPISFLIDITNYVMLDLSQPMHAFDGQKLQAIEGRLAKKGEKLTLLDDQELELTTVDYVITDGKMPISLAGVMGGKNSGVSSETNSLFLESANFDATSIRRSAARFKQRTEASARFEKTLDPNQNIDAILRFFKIFDDNNIRYSAADYVASVGKQIEPVKVELSHDFLCARIGTDVDPDLVAKILKKIECAVEYKDGQYVVTVPTFRCSKDVTTAEDVVEEVARFFGYENIPQELPYKKVRPVDLSEVMKLRSIKKLCAHSMRMREVYNYALYDEPFLKELQFEPEDCLEIKNPLSETWTRMVTSLIPHLLRNVVKNSSFSDSLRFFEWGRTWNISSKKVNEQKKLAGIFFERKKDVDFYESKALLSRLFAMLDIDLRWKKADRKKCAPWCALHQTAELVHDEKVIGYAGKINPEFFEHVQEGDGFIFELDGDLLLSYKAAEKQYRAASKYPGVQRDMSMLLPISVTFDDVTDAILSVDSRVGDIQLIDLFTKKKWVDQKSLTVHLMIQDETKTLTGQEAEDVYTQIVKKLQKLGATIR